MAVAMAPDRDGGWEGEGQEGRGSAGRVLHPSSAGHGAVTARDRAGQKRENRGTHYICTKAFILSEFLLTLSTVVSELKPAFLRCVMHPSVQITASPPCRHPRTPTGLVPITPASPSFPSHHPLPDGILKGLPKQLRKND